MTTGPVVWTALGVPCAVGDGDRDVTDGVGEGSRVFVVITS